MSMRYHTYIRVTLEFLSSWKSKFYRGHIVKRKKIKFRLFNIEYKWTLAQFISIYGLSMGDNRWEHTNFDARGF